MPTNKLINILQEEKLESELENLRIQARVRNLDLEIQQAYLDGYADCLLYVNKISDLKEKKEKDRN